MLSNPNKVNYRSVDHEDVHVVNIDGAEIMTVCVKEAPESMKLVYFNGKHPVIIAKRIRKEEALLEKELEGYAAYKKKVKYKVIPFIW